MWESNEREHSNVNVMWGLIAVVAISALAAGVPHVVRGDVPATSEHALTDADISAAVEDELFTHSAVPHDAVDISVANGIVSLTGRVQDLLARDRAGLVAQTVRGVRAIVNRIEVRPRVPRTDAQLKQDVEEALAYDPAADAYEIRVSVQDGVAKLTGQVDSFAERDLSERIARGVRGLREVNNALVVRYWNERPDNELLTDVRERLRWDEYVDPVHVDVSVKNGAVTLTGRVGSDAERSRAYFDAWVVGVKSVETRQLMVDPDLKSEHKRTAGRRVDDREVERAVKEALRLDPRVQSFALTPRVVAGALTLRGTVDNLQAKQAAVEDARGTTGVSRVIDRVRLQPVAVDDETIARSIRKAFGRDPYVERYEVLVSVHDGVASLNGTVDSYFEKLRADQLAARAKGVRRVTNLLTVYDDRSPLVYEPRARDAYPYDYSWYRFGPVSFRADADVLQDIRDELFWSPYVDAEEVAVTVHNSVATLKGSVDSYSEMYSALANAYEGGATSVHNELRVE